MEAVTSDIPREVEDILVDIKYIGGLPPGKKYNIGSKTYVSATGLISRGHRTLKNMFDLTEDRIATIDFLNNTISQAIKISKKFPRWQELICKEINLISNALTNVRHVYHDDPYCIGKIDTVLLRIHLDALRNACSEEEPVFVERPQ